jgi:CHASE2 domain-containing sensor protein
LRDPIRLRQQQKQWEALERYLNSWFVNEDGSYRAGFSQFETVDEFEQQLERHLRRLIKDKVSTVVTVTESRTVTWYRGSPFRGLEYFDFEHAPVFFGRTRAVGEIREALVRRAASGSAFVLILGMSGSGKSSLIRAGVLPTLTYPGVVEGIGLWRWGIFRPSDAPSDLLEGIGRLLFDSKVLPELGAAGATIETLVDAFKHAPEQAMLPVRMALSRAGEEFCNREKLTAPVNARLLLIVDQLEEMFTLDGLTQSDREAFIELLASLASSGMVWVIGGMRSDFYHRAAELPGLVALSEGVGIYHLLPPRHAEIVQIIREPARATGITFEVDPNTGIGLDALLEEAALRATNALPLLEFTLSELFEQRSESGTLTVAAYNRLGGLEGALSQHAEKTYQTLSAAEKSAFPGVIRALVAVTRSDSREFIARPAYLSAFPEGDPSRTVVETFMSPQVRLFVAEGSDKEATVRVAHEALFSGWERASDIILADREFLSVRQRVETAKARWEEEGRSQDLLLPFGKSLKEAEEILAQRRDELGRDLADYINRSSDVQREKERIAREMEEREVKAARLLARRRQLAARARGFAYFCLFVSVVLQVSLSDQSLSPLRNTAFDAYQRLLPRQVTRDTVVIVAIDDESLAALGRWPWPRTRLARLIEETHRLGAQAVGLNLIMPEADSLSPDLLLADRQDVSHAMQNALASLPSNDAILVQTLRRIPTVVGRGGHFELETRNAAQSDQTPVMIEGDDPLRHLPFYSGHLTNISEIEAAAAGRGYLNHSWDTDGVVRSMPLLIAVKGKTAPSFALELVRVAVGERQYSVLSSSNGINGVRIGTSFIPTDSEGRIRLYFSPSFYARRVSARAILGGEIAPAGFANQLVIIGTTALGVSDVVTTPIGIRMYGVEIQAQLIENIVTRSQMIRPRYATLLECLTSLLLGLLTLLLLPRLRTIWQFLIITGIALIIATGSLAAFFYMHLLIDAIIPLLTMILVYFIGVSSTEATRFIRFAERV